MEKSDYPKILIGGPTYEGKGYCLTEFVNAVKGIVYPNKEVLFIDNSNTEDFSKKMNRMGLPTIWQPEKHHRIASKKMSKACNFLRNKVLTEDFDYYYSVETDMLPTPSTLVDLLAIYRTISDYTQIYEKVVGSLYRIYGGAGAKRCGYLTTYDKVHKQTMSHEIDDFYKLPTPYVRVSSCGLGSCLIPRGVLDKIEFKGGISTTPDKNFFDDLTKKKIDTFLYTKELVEHMNRGDWEHKIFN